MSKNRIKPIKNEQDYQEAIELLEEFIDAAPEPNTSAAEQLEVLTSLIKGYEENNYEIDLPSAVEAIKFVMDQRDLEPKDLIPYLGSKARVSEVLSGKRNLSIEMIRSLEAGLGIPAKALLKKTELSADTEYDSWNIKVFEEMKKRGYFEGIGESIKDKGALLQQFFESINRKSTVQALLKQSSYRTSTTDKSALAAWSGYVIKEADKIQVKNIDTAPIDANFMKEIVKLSAESTGPLLARSVLLKKGIKLVIEPAFPKTYIDGATIFTEDYPIIGLTLRQDRLDNFWFVLLHELAHIVLHSNDDKIDVFYDEVYENEDGSLSTQEQDADSLAAESLVSLNDWEISPAHLMPSEITFNLLANSLGIHPAIIAGKYRYETQNWRMFSDIIKDHKIRYLFEETI